MQRPAMFYGAPAHVFEKARELRKAMTPAEQRLWEQISNKQLRGYKFRRQHPISEFIADFYCHSARLVIEVAGGIHDLENQKHYDNKRNKEMNRLELIVIRFTNKQIEEELEDVLKKIGSYLHPCIP